MITAGATHQHLAEGFPVAMRLHSAPVLRLADAKPVQLGHVAEADGAWRLYAFADADGGRLRSACGFLGSIVARFTPPGAEPDSVIDLRAVFQQSHRELEVDALPPALLPRKGVFGLIDYEKAFCPDPREEDIFAARAVDRDGCIVVVRPDGYVANLLPLDGHEALAGFLEGVLIG
jgi:phenol 2-monooxygenase